MNELPYFLRLIGANKLICDVLATSSISDHELLEQTYIRTAPGKVNLKNFALGDTDTFRDVAIWITPFGTLIDFLTDDLEYFHNALHYFNCIKKAKKKKPVLENGVEYQVKGRKTEKFSMLSKNVHGTIFQSESFGCMISLGFFYEGDDKITHKTRVSRPSKVNPIEPLFGVPSIRVASTGLNPITANQLFT